MSKDLRITMELFSNVFLGMPFRSFIGASFEATQLSDDELNEKIRICIDNQDMQTGQILLAEFANRNLKDSS